MEPTDKMDAGGLLAELRDVRESAAGCHLSNDDLDRVIAALASLTQPASEPSEYRRGVEDDRPTLERTQTIPTRPRCHNCGKRVVCDFVADDAIWIECFGAIHGPGYRCLDCFAEVREHQIAADQSGEAAHRASDGSRND